MQHIYHAKSDYSANFVSKSEEKFVIYNKQNHTS